MIARLSCVALAIALGLGAQPESIAPPLPDIKPADIHNTFDETHNGHKHEAIDLLAPRGTPVHAVVDGTIQKLFNSKPGGITIYQFDNASVYCYYYAHLDRYADGVKEGMKVTSGQVIGYVGSTGNADPGTPHLHFTIFQIGLEKHWWQGTPINPYPLLLNPKR